ncbi:putative Dol-P-Man:Man(7)GlcNAc(2)-PP-Dol alpha-1,6-mannosyltransferase [Hypsizygus marmoreus]|uniref:Mannosyltransferase n=1 Tax=Hypsizygus marmoreus TaxID=39966 RepID=A0A369KDB4_HYPMA|nr:putative Dol-P-Man:Man(7)GlcNAc(2)-PP-Dol alpha-1,6-mannosyltransferase [Hypsizygus marmoreus]
MSIALDGLLFAVGWAHVLLAPYTKVEESFNLHATHDVLMYGTGPSTLHNYDHFTFPGAVPRTFVGSVILAWLSKPIIQLANQQGLISQKADMQVIVRLVLATLNALGLILVRRAASRRFGRLTGVFFTFLSISQFHLPFWMGRTLPNMYALLPVNIATSFLIDRAPNSMKPPKMSTIIAIALLTFTAVVVRAEVVLFLVPVVLQSLLLKYCTITDVIKVGFVSGVLSTALTILVDSYFWGDYYTWPELTGLYFNVYQGKSAEWGTSPRAAYWTTHLPKLLLSSLPLSIVGFFLDQRIRTLLLPSFLFIGLIGGLGHKEWRFIIYVVPIFNVAAARGAKWMVSLPKRTILGRLLFLAVISLLAFNVLVTYFFTLTSIHNYPGGQALALFHQLYPQGQTRPPPHIHICNLAAQSGASLFLQENAPPYPSPSYLASAHPVTNSTQWTYNKTESLSLKALTSSKSITHLISETKPDNQVQRDWKVVASVEGFKRWDVDTSLLKAGPRDLMTKSLFDVVKMVSEEKLWILERKR